ncbi:MAG TPA: regulatory protein RecX, partial [Anaerolineae bacterium]|nr:regulatory protein RecX [Anaerolineae bacterium]
NRVNVYLDDEFAFGLAAFTAVSLRIGQHLTEADIDKLKVADSQETAKQAAIRFIEYRPRSTAEVRRRLRQKGFDEAAIDHAIERLQAVALLDDLAFARYWVDQRETFKPRSQMALRQELQQKGVNRDIIDEAIAPVDDMATARRLAQKQAPRWHNLEEEAFRAKMAGYLQRRGFPYDIIKQVTVEMWETITNPADTSLT